MPNIYRASFPDKYENRNSSHHEKNKKKKKLKFKDFKENTIKSLNDTEYFLNNIGFFIKHVKLYKMLKK